MPFVRAAGHSLEYEWIEGREPTLVFLHEGLGSIGQWRDFPSRVAKTTGRRALVYNRYGYGDSDVLAEPRVTSRFMHDEALVSLPQMLAALEIESPILVGHSDGASIALIHAGGRIPGARPCVDGAARVRRGDRACGSIQRGEAPIRNDDLRERLGRYHRDAATDSSICGTMRGSILSSGTGISRSICPRSRCRSSRSRGSMTNTGRWRN
jgi:hypothetical protein